MGTTLEDLREQIRREERVAGLRADGHVTDAAIQRRRLQIALVSVVVFLGLVMTTLVDDLWVDLKRNSSIVDPTSARLAMIVFAVAFIAYALEKERHLRRLTTLGHEARAINLELAERILSSAALADVERNLAGCLRLDDALRVVLDEALRIVVAATGSVQLLTEDGELHEVVARPVDGGPRVADSLVAQVALAREPMLLSGPVPLEVDPGAKARGDAVSSVVCAPLVHADVLLGVLTLGAPPTERFGDDDLALVRQFAGRAADVIARARRFEAAVLMVDKPTDLLADEVRSASSAIRDVVAALRDDAVAPQDRLALLAALDANAQRLLGVTA
ncbi:MAG TPA: GAF domain-containing protein [Acidimicrobiia bacterium]|nr:GAF domain-containing protein [Acidimicrobiia bacterium]